MTKVSASLIALAWIAGCSSGGNSPDAGGTSDAGQPDGGGDADAGPSCPALTGVEVRHQNDVTTDETWAGDGTVHHVVAGISVRPGATLTLAPCAVVHVANQQLS